MTDQQIDDLWLAAVRASHEDGRVRQRFALLVYEAGVAEERAIWERECDKVIAAIRARGNNEPR